MISGPASLDTSVVVRLLVGEPLDQYQSAEQFLREQVGAQALVLVSDLVMAEAYFALQSFYQITKADALQSLLLFVQHSGVTVSVVTTTVLSLPNLATAKPGFVDRLIHGASHEAGHTLVTFEKAARRLPSTHLLPS
jgi:predicted nucleic-acid-binding protein